MLAQRTLRAGRGTFQLAPGVLKFDVLTAPRRRRRLPALSRARRGPSSLSLAPHHTRDSRFCYPESRPENRRVDLTMERSGPVRRDSASIAKRPRKKGGKKERQKRIKCLKQRASDRNGFLRAVQIRNVRKPCEDGNLDKKENTRGKRTQ
ncbi:unnamed protein product, partial [Iphiclides podalirius]